MDWLIRQFSGLFSWLWARIYSAFEWLLDSLGSVFTWFCNHVQAVAVGLVASVGAVMPSETLEDTWRQVLASWDWFDPWVSWFADTCLSMPEFFARATYLGGVVLAAYAVRGLFMGVRAFLDLF